MNKKKIGWLLVAIGFTAISYYTNQLGIGNLFLAFQKMGWGIVVLLTIPLFLFYIHAVGWSYTLSKENRQKIGLFRMTVLQSITYGISGVLPLQGIVSEPLKLLFINGEDYDKDDFAASLVIDNTINGIAIFAVATAGLIYFAISIASGVWIWVLLAFLSGVMIVLFKLIILIQKKGIIGGVIKLLGRVSYLPKFNQSHIEKAERIDNYIRSFYQKSSRNFWLSFFFHIVEKLHGVAEFWVIFYFLGQNISWGSCFFIFAVVSTLDNLLFFAQLGGMEAWVSSLLHFMKINRNNINITVALFRRVRFIFWAIIALLLIIYPLQKAAKHKTNH